MYRLKIGELNELYKGFSKSSKKKEGEEFYEIVQIITYLSELELYKQRVQEKRKQYFMNNLDNDEFIKFYDKILTKDIDQWTKEWNGDKNELETNK